MKPVTADEVFADQSARGVSPALLCYVRRRELVDTLHREAEPEAIPEVPEGEGQELQVDGQEQQQPEKKDNEKEGVADEAEGLITL